MTDSIGSVLQDMAAVLSLLTEEITKITDRVTALQQETGDSQLALLPVGDIISDNGSRCYRLERARDLLKKILRDGPLTSKQVYEMGKRIDVSSTTLRRARDLLGVEVISLRKGTNRFLWSLKSTEEQ